MYALKYRLPLHLIVFTEPRYFPNDVERQKMISSVTNNISGILHETDPGLIVENISITNDFELENFLNQKHKGFGLFVPASGAVQPWMIKAAESFEGIGILAAYEPGLLDQETAYRLLEANAAPAAADVYSVIKRQRKPAALSLEISDILDLLQIIQTADRMKKAVILLAGVTEDWVISSCRSFEKIKEKTGMDFIGVTLEELYRIYESITDEDAKQISNKWIENAKEIIEPKKQDIIAASRLAVAIYQLVRKYNSDGIAIACFTLLRELGTTSCIALSMLNDSRDFIGACEGDMDSAVTLFMMKALTDKPSWMANPMLEKNNVLRLSHCTSPLLLEGKPLPYILRNHHESGIGVSPEALIEEGIPVTITRIGNNLSSLSVSTGITLDTPPTPTCRTQLRIKPDSMSSFIDNLLGCHQIVTFGNWERQLTEVGKLLGLKVLK